jgi:hypothetical protein
VSFAMEGSLFLDAVSGYLKATPTPVILVQSPDRKGYEGGLWACADVKKRPGGWPGLL